MDPVSYNPLVPTVVNPRTTKSKTASTKASTKPTGERERARLEFWLGLGLGLGLGLLACGLLVAGVVALLRSRKKFRNSTPSPLVEENREITIKPEESNMTVEL